MICSLLHKTQINIVVGDAKNSGRRSDGTVDPMIEINVNVIGEWETKKALEEDIASCISDLKKSLEVATEGRSRT